MKNGLFWMALFVLTGCSSPVVPSALQLPEQGLSIKLEQRNSTTITRVPAELRIEIGDITRGHVLISVWNNVEVLLRESIHENESFPFVWNNEKLRIACVQLDNELIGPDFGYFKLSNDTGVNEPVVQPVVNGMSEKATILRLIEVVEQADIIFIRNGEEHTPKEAADHLRSKYSHSEKEIQTVEQFIKGIASKSSLSNEPYQVRLKDGSFMNAEAWFRDRLMEIR